MCGVVCVVSQYDVVSRHFRSHNLATPQLVSSESSPGYSEHVSSYILALSNPSITFIYAHSSRKYISTHQGRREITELTPLVEEVRKQN